MFSVNTSLKSNEQISNTSMPQFCFNVSVKQNKTGDDLNEMRFWNVKLTKTINKITSLRERIAKFSKKHHYFKLHLLHMKDNQMEGAVLLHGVPAVPSHELFELFHEISKQVKLYCHESNIVSIWQVNQSNTSLKEFKNSSHPSTIVILKTLKFKNRYIKKVKKLSKYNPNAMKNGFEVCFKNKTFNVFVNDRYPFELANLFRRVSIVAKQYGFPCYVNDSHVFISRNSTDRIVITNELQLNLFRQNKHVNFTNKESPRRSEVLIDIFNPYMYRKSNDDQVKKTRKN